MGWRRPAWLVIVALLAGLAFGQPVLADDRPARGGQSEAVPGNSLVAPAERTALDSLLEWTDRLIDIIPDAGPQQECAAGLERCCCDGECYCKRACSLKPCR
jgi:hypothetical protein